MGQGAWTLLRKSECAMDHWPPGPLLGHPNPDLDTPAPRFLPSPGSRPLELADPSHPLVSSGASVTCMPTCARCARAACSASVNTTPRAPTAASARRTSAHAPGEPAPTCRCPMALPMPVRMEPDQLQFSSRAPARWLTCACASTPPPPHTHTQRRGGAAGMDTHTLSLQVPSSYTLDCTFNPSCRQAKPSRHLVRHPSSF